jgi:Na+-translocating ferredoxin:NAD+ oxidoreductase RNF subunit RnfB
MAESLLAGDSKLTQCKPGTQEMREQIAEYISTHPNEEGEYTKVKW